MWRLRLNPEIHETDHIERQPQPRRSGTDSRRAPVKQIDDVVNRFVSPLTE